MRARKYDWYTIALHIAFFLGFLEEEYATSYLLEARKLSHEQVLDHIMSLAPKSRLQELGMDKAKMDNWANIAFTLKKIVWDYDPKGMVKCMDVFYTRPMPGLGILSSGSIGSFRNGMNLWSREVPSIMLWSGLTGP
jgi:hypothetical protein